MWSINAIQNFDKNTLPINLAALFVKTARRQFLENANIQVFSEEALTGILKGLEVQLSSIADPTLSFEISARRAVQVGSIARFKNLKFNYELLDINSLLQFYPVLDHLLNQVTKSFVAAHCEFLERLCNDASILAEAFGICIGPQSIKSVKSGIADVHAYGRTVILFSLNKGPDILYKPRSLLPDLAFEALSVWLSQNNAPYSPRTSRVLDRGSYGWVVADIATTPNSKKGREIVRRSGALLSIAHLLGATDWHYENVLLSGGHPVLIDCETLMQPFLKVPRRYFAKAGYRADRMLRESVLRTGFLCNSDWAFDDFAKDDPSFMRNLLEKIQKLLVEEDAAFNKSSNFWQEFSNEFIFGFQEMYRFFLIRKDELRLVLPKIFAGIGVRIVPRATRFYLDVLRHARKHEFMRSDLQRSVELELLQVALSQEEKKPEIWPLVNEEISALEREEIPYFSTEFDSLDLLSWRGYRIFGALEETCRSALDSRICCMSEEDLERQTVLIETSFALAEPVKFNGLAHSMSCNTSLEQPFDIIIQIAEWLRAEAIVGKDHTATWIGLTRHGAKGYTIRPLGVSLYDGVCGVALFLANICRLVPATQQYMSLIPHALNYASKEISRKPIDFGGLSGQGSLLYTASCTFEWNQEAAGKLLRLALDGVTAERLEKEKELDVASGLAGLILGLLAVERRTKFATEALEKAITAGRRISNLWHNSDGKRKYNQEDSGGFAHGLSGMAFALYRLSIASGIKDFYYLATSFINGAKRWNLEEIKKAEVSTPLFLSWCRGSSGDGLAYLTLVEEGFLLEKDWIEVIRACVQIAQSKTIHSIDNLCCGTFGRLELLNKAASFFGDEQLRSRAQMWAQEVLASLSKKISLNCVPSSFPVRNPTLFQGLSGAAYMVLRLAHYETDSVLTLTRAQSPLPLGEFNA